MKKSILSLISFTIAYSVSSQYYYKDIIGTKESAEIIKAYRNNKVTKVTLSSFEADGSRSQDFFVEQQFTSANSALRTITSSLNTGQSFLISYANANGNIVKTIDSNSIVVNTTVYTYNDSNQLVSITSNSSDTTNFSNQLEEHLWEYKNGNVNRMLRIKNKKDTTYVNFKLDEKGNVVEEQSVRKGVPVDAVYYYYDDNNRITDIVRFNNKVKRLLPEYMFEYSSKNQVIQKITVPGNSSQYLIWRYQYNARGLKSKEAVYNKGKKLTGRIEYQYTFGT